MVEGVFGHDEADITMISYVFEDTNQGIYIIRVLIDDTDVFILLVYWVYRANLQMEWLDSTLLYTNATSNELGSTCLQLLSMHVPSGCDTMSHPLILNW